MTFDPLTTTGPLPLPPSVRVPERSEEALGGKLTTAVRSLDDAIMDLLGVAHLIRVVRTDKSFVANETLATAWSEVRITTFNDLNGTFGAKPFCMWPGLL